MSKTTLRYLSARLFVCMVSLVICILMFAMSSTAFAAGTTTVDLSTADNWAVLNYNTQEGRTTKNDGRIWTDKSVWNTNAIVLKNNNDEKLTITKSDDSDFLVGLSALSSTMSIDGVTEKPLDIVMVLDVSGSMDESMGYAEVYAGDMDRNGAYYIKRNNGYTKLNYSYQASQGRRWYYQAGGRTTWVTPKTSAEDNTSGSVQVYKPVTKMEALEDAVNTFIDSTVEMNSEIADSSKQHRIALVKFSGNKNDKVGNNTYTSGGYTYNYSQVVKEFGFVTDATVQSFHNSVDALTPAGATRADRGLEVAEGLMDDVRSNAQPVVIFFTDGVPTTVSDWDASVANGAINAAKSMKDDGAWIYSVGVFADSDPTDDGSLGRYMNAVSGNYPKATGYTNSTMGNRVQADENYYHTAEDASELLAVFDSIAEEIAGKAAEYPTHIEEGYDASKGGYVTFVDKLGAYMEVTTFNSVVFGGREYKNTAAAGSDVVFVNNTTVTNDLGNEVRIDSVVVTIERSENTATGDIITVKVPAALIPLAYYKVEVTDEGAVTERIPTTPIRAFYEVSLKDDARELLTNPDSDMQEYIAANTDDDGKVIFYSNAFDVSANAQIGSTEATFTPSKVNDMYFAVEDTPIFSDLNCTTPVTRINENATYYYKRVYYVESTEPVDAKYEIVAFPASALRNVNYVFNRESGQLIVKAGNGRYTRADAVDTVKKNNETGTAALAASPKWENWNTPGSEVTVFLGNNGILKEDIPGTLAISKRVSLPAWSSAQPSAKEFKFNIILNDADGNSLEGTFDAQVKTASGANAGNAYTVTTDSEGSVSVTLKAEQTLYVYGLPAGTQYTVKETDIPAGFKQTSPADAQPAKGTIASGTTTTAAFVNTYSATGTLIGKTNLDGNKTLTGRDWRDSDKFAFALAPENANNPMPEGAQAIDGTVMSIVTVSGSDADRAFNFGDITYTQPGTYKYEIREVVVKDIADRVLGISYSQAVYEVTVVVADNGDGTLTATSTMKLVGGSITDSAEFVNTFETEKVTFGIVGRKHLNDVGGIYELSDDDFTFKLEPVTKGAPMPAGTVDGVYTTTNKGINIAFGTIECTLSEEAIINAGGTLTYTYKVSEVKGDIPGIQYDSNSYEVNVKFTWNDGLQYDIDYPGNNAWITFTNTYDLEDEVVVINGTKTLTGRSWGENETFDFVFKSMTDGAPMPEGSDNGVYNLKVGKEGTFSININYSRPGVYIYELREIAGQDNMGIQYDTHIAAVTVTVTDGGEGKLVSEVTYNGATTFENKYVAGLTYPGITVEKTLLGRDMAFGEFEFSIEAVNQNAKNKGISASDTSFESGAHEDGETCTMTDKLSVLVFTQEDADKEFVYKVMEIIPEDDDAQHDGIQQNGVTFDETQYWIVIVPKDNGDGTMYATTKIYTDEDYNDLVKEYSTKEQAVPTVSFNNEYGFKDVTVDTGVNAFFTKIFEGREWLDTDTFEFRMSVADGSEKDTPIPENAVVAVGKPASGNSAVVDFGSIIFTEEGVYKYNITETKGNAVNVVYDEHTATLTVNVTDNGLGKLVAATSVENGVFTNRYSSEVYYPAVTKLDVTKSLTGRELREHQFAFKVVPLDIPSMNKAGMQTLEGIQFRNGAPAEDGISHMFSPDNLRFTEDDLGITYTYTFSETNEGVKGYTYDSNAYTLEISPFYEDGQIKVATKVTDQNGTVHADVVGYTGKEEIPVVTIAFENGYEAEPTSADIAGTKEMTGRELIENEFTFVLAYAVDPDKNAITETTNDAEDKVVFATQTYTLEALDKLVADGYASKASGEMVDVYTIGYVAFEKAGNTAGVTHTDASFNFTVTVTDNGEGELSSVVNLPDGGLAFKNTYSTGEPIDFVINGQKILSAAEGLTPDSIEGKFTFELNAQTEGAPMPDVVTATNDAAGNIVFERFKLDMDLLKDVEAVDNVRTKEFVYTVTESGNAEGITNDPVAEKTFSITLTDDGEGNLTAVADPAEGPMFTFTNTYDADEVTESITGEGNLTVMKTLNGRGLKDGEFKFELVEGQEVVAEGTNDSAGTVTFEAVTYDKIGTHTYSVREVQGEAGGVTYDTTTYQVKAVVTDNGKGQLVVDFGIVGEGIEDIVFTNEYKPTNATLTVVPGKAFEGSELKEDQFSFRMTAVTENAPMPESDVVANDAEGKINFGEITYTEAGTYEYTIVEIKGNVENVLYDETVHNMKVVVTDNCNGQLEAKVTFDGKDEAPVFVNRYVEPNPDTGDDMSMIFCLMMAVTCLIVAVYCVRRKRTN